MNGLRAAEHFTSNARVRDVSTVGDDRSRDRQRALGIVGGLADTPFVFAIVGIARDGVPGASLEATNAMRVLVQHFLTRQRFRLLANCIAGRNPG